MSVIPTVSLSPLSFISPQVTGETLSIDSSVFPFTLVGDKNTIHIEIYQGSTVLTYENFIFSGGNNLFQESISISGSQSLLFLGRNYNPSNIWQVGTAYPIGYTLIDSNGNVQSVTTSGVSGNTIPIWPTSVGTTVADGDVVWSFIGQPAISPTFKLNLIHSPSGLSSSINPPTGLSSNKGTDTCTLQWVIPTYVGLVGIRVQLSTDITGVSVPYVQFGQVSASVTSSSSLIISNTTNTSTVGNITTVTNTQQVQPINYGTVEVPSTAVGGADVFYAMFSTVVQDPYTNTVFESQVNGPITCGFVNLQVVSTTDFLPAQSKEDIASRLITQVNNLYPNLDLSPRSETRDVFIDPIAIELAAMSVRDWFAKVSTSISAMAQIDDANGDGISDVVSQSTIKQTIQAAYGLSDADTQTLISRQFDILGEQAGVSRGGAQASVVQLTFYTYVKPTSIITIPLGAVVSSIADSDNPSFNFVTTASAIIDPQNLASYYDPVNGWWGVAVPAQCNTLGSTTNVGAESITQGVSGVTGSVNVINLQPAQDGDDNQSNADYAAIIQNRLVVGVDTGSVSGYLDLALETPSIISAQVVPAGALYMLRDWDTLRQKHANGCVDIYVKGNLNSQQNEFIQYEYENTGIYGTLSSYDPLKLIQASTLRFQIVDPQFSSLYTAIQVAVQRGSSVVYMGCSLAQIDTVGGYLYLNANEQIYTLNADGTTSPVTTTVNGVQIPQTNLAFLQGTGTNLYTFSLFARYLSPLSHVPALQPVIEAVSVQGPITGTINPSLVNLVRTTDFLLTGGSTTANDTILIQGTNSQTLTKTLTLSTNPVQIDINMAVPVNSDGSIGNIISVRSLDLSTIYTFGVDYTIVPTGAYSSYALNIPTGSPILTQTVAIGSTLQVVVTYHSFLLQENTTTITDEAVTLAGTNPSILTNDGVVNNVWLPVSHGNFSLVNDSQLTSIAYNSRFIKIIFNNTVMLENSDFTLSVDPTSGQASLTRILTGRIPDGGAVTVTYIIVETFNIATTYPAYVQILANKVAAMKHACADALVKAEVQSPVDITISVVLNEDADETITDGRIRSALGILLSQSSTSLTQSGVISKVMGVQGVSSVVLPLNKLTKSDGTYDIGQVIPTNTSWLPLAQDNSFLNVKVPLNSWISGNVVLQNATIPSGGPADAYVGLLYQGDSYRRASSVQDFLQNSETASFYIIGTNDTLDGNVTLGSSYAGKILLCPSTAANPALLSYFVTYQVWGMSGAQDITVSSTEYLTAGNIFINYVN